MGFENENLVSGEENDYVRLQELSNSNYEMMDAEPNIIGWNVNDNEGNKLGEVDELIFDPQARKVRYLVLNMEDNELDLEEERRVLIPIGIAQLHNDDDEVVLPNVTTTQLSKLPHYEGCPELTPELEMDIRRVLDGSSSAAGGSTAPYDHPQFYAHEHFDENRFFSRGKRKDMGVGMQDDELSRTEKVDRIMAKIHQNDELSADQSESAKNLGDDR